MEVSSGHAQAAMVKQHLRRLQEMALGLTAAPAAPSAEAGADLSLSGELMRKAAAISESDTQEAMAGVLRSLGTVIGRLAESVETAEAATKRLTAELEQVKSSSERAVDVHRAAAQSAEAEASRLRSRVDALEERVRAQEAAGDRLRTAVAADAKSAERACESNSEAIRTCELKLTEVVSKISSVDTQVEEVRVQMKRVCSERRFQELESRAKALEQYNQEYLALSQRSTSSFEADMETRIKALDARYAQLLKHYYSQLMQHMGQIQESVDKRTRALSHTLENEVGRVSDEIECTSQQWRVQLETTQHDIQKIERRVLSAYRHLKDAQLSAAPAMPSRATAPPPPPPAAPDTTHTTHRPNATVSQAHAPSMGLGLSDLRAGSPRRPEFQSPEKGASLGPGAPLLASRLGKQDRLNASRTGTVEVDHFLRELDRLSVFP